MTKKEIKNMNDSELVAAFYLTTVDSVKKANSGRGMKGVSKDLCNLAEEMSLRFNLDRDYILKEIEM